MGFLSSDAVESCSVTDLIGEYLGQTGPKVKNLFETALGKVLFIDEAYRLLPDRGSSRYAHEAIGELVDLMTQPRYAGKMIVILAGYTTEMDLLLQSNPGLRSRFPADVVFSPMKPQQCILHLQHQLGKVGIEVQGQQTGVAGREVWIEAHRILDQLSNTEGWANGRDIETLAKTIMGNAFRKAATSDRKAIGGDGVAKLAISVGEIVQVLAAMLDKRRAASGSDYLRSYL